HMLRHDSPIEPQAELFLSLLGDHMLRAMMDCEHHYDKHGHVLPNPAPTADDILAFGQLLEASLGYAPILYTYDSYLAHELANDARPRHYPLCIANYGRNPTTSFPWVAWQYTSVGAVPGITGHVDEHHV